MQSQMGQQQVDENGNPIPPQTDEQGNPVPPGPTPASAAGSGQATNLQDFAKQAVTLSHIEESSPSNLLMNLAREMLDAAEEQTDEE